jgi:thioredoxin 1
MSYVEITADNFESEVLGSDVPVLLDFWAVWCGPCKMVEPIVEQLATEYAGKAKVGKVNVDEQQSLSQQFGVMSIPTLMVFKGGQPVETLIGVQPKPAIEEKINAHL